MRRFLMKMLVVLVSLAVLAPAAGAAQKTQRTEAYSLDDIMDSPKEYLEREVMFYARFATTANLFKQVNTRFNAGSHVNLAVWPDKSVLWTEEGRKNILPTLYVAKNEQAALDELRGLERYELVALTGTVRNVYAGYPWILVTKIERAEKPSERLGEQVIEHMQAGKDALDAGAGGAAAQHFEQAMRFGLPAEYRGEAHKQLARAYLLENRLDRARDSLRRAVDANRKDPRLHLALADVCLQMGDAEEALAHASAALDISGKYPQAYGIRGESLSLLGDYAAAFTELNTAAGTPGITPREKAVISLRRARMYARSDRPADAARLYAAVSDPGEALAADPSVHNEIGLFYEELHLRSGDARYLDSAAAAFGEAAALATLNPAFLYNQAEVEFRKEKLTDAPDTQKVLETLEKINRIDPDYPAARLLLGRVRFQQGEPEEAEQMYRSVAPQLKSDSTALLALAEAYIELGRFDDALAAVQSARDSQPWNTRLRALGTHIEAAARASIAQKPAADGAAEITIEVETAEAEAAVEAEIEIEKPALTVLRLPVPAHEMFAAPHAEETPEVPVLPVPPAAAGSAAVTPGFIIEGIGIEDFAALDSELVRFDATPAMRAPSGAAPGRLPMARVTLPERLAPDREEGVGTADFIRLEDETPKRAPVPVTKHEAAPRTDGFIRLGRGHTVSSLNGVTAAYASIPAPAAQTAPAPTPVAGGDGVRIPPVFTFTPDTSPVIIADLRSRNASGRSPAVRNANLYKRRPDSGRRPAEIIDRAPVSPYPADSSAMVAPDTAAALPRAEVRLPSSSRGIGAVAENTGGAR